jgi:hypothetical protein
MTSVAMVSSQNINNLNGYYEHFWDKTNKLGILATRTFFTFTGLLNQDITLPQSFSQPLFPRIHNFRTLRRRPLPHGDGQAFGLDILPVVQPQLSPMSNLEVSNVASNHQNSADKHADLKALVRQSHEVMVSATTVFPFKLFPDTIVLDRTKITITRRDFFMSSKVMSIRIEDILNVSTSVGPFFGSINIASRVLSSEDHFSISHFWRHDAVHLKHMIQGFVIAQHNGIETKHLSREHLIETLAELGHDSN